MYSCSAHDNTKGIEIMNYNNRCIDCELPQAVHASPMAFPENKLKQFLTRFTHSMFGTSIIQPTFRARKIIHDRIFPHIQKYIERNKYYSIINSRFWFEQFY